MLIEEFFKWALASPASLLQDLHAETAGRVASIRVAFVTQQSVGENTSWLPYLCAAHHGLLHPAALAAPAFVGWLRHAILPRQFRDGFVTRLGFPQNGHNLLALESLLQMTAWPFWAGKSIQSRGVDLAVEDNTKPQASKAVNYL